MLRASAIGVAVTALVATRMFAQDKTAQIDKIFSFATADTPGCAVGVSQAGKVVLNRTYGLADVERRIPLRETSIFDIGSAQKQFTAAAVLLLVQDGRISLGDDIRKYLPEMYDHGRTITVDNLITHTSGIRDWTALVPMAEDGVGLIPLIMRQRGLNSVPGEAWSYSSSGFELAKEIVARVSGMPFGDFAQRRMFAPLGMTSTSYVPDIMQGKGDRALGYQQTATGWKPYMRLGAERGGGALISTTRDLLRWNDALTSGKLGKIVTAKIQETATLANGRTLSYARGLNVDSIPGGRMVSHSGSAYGYSAWVGRFTDHALSVAVACNFDPVSATALAGKVADVFLPPVDPNGRPPGPVAVAGVDVAPRAGLFFEEGTGEPLRLTSNSGRLMVQGGPVLVPVSADRFQPQRASLFFRSQDKFELTFRSNDELEIKSMESLTTRYRRAQPWTPSAADLQAADGRYRSDDLGTVWEVFPGQNGLMFRFERAPERVVGAEPVARDVYMQGPVIVRFLRDANGAIAGFDYSNPVALHVRFDRVGARSSSAPSVAATKDSATSGPKLEDLVGEYELAPGRSITITLEGGRLHGQPTGSSKQPLVHTTGATFAVGRADAPATVTFTLGADGRATAMVMRQNGNERTLTRVK